MSNSEGTSLFSPLSIAAETETVINLSDGSRAIEPSSPSATPPPSHAAHSATTRSLHHSASLPLLSSSTRNSVDLGRERDRKRVERIVELAAVTRGSGQSLGGNGDSVEEDAIISTKLEPDSETSSLAPSVASSFDDKLSISAGRPREERRNRLLPSHSIVEGPRSRSNSPSRPPQFLDDITRARTAATTSTSPRSQLYDPRHRSSAPPSLPAATPKTPARIASPLAPQNAAVSSLLRRNYTYFASLLQEPEAKWRALSDSAGITVTQLDSIDPTTKIYRAERIFIGIGVWESLSTICTARAQWDKTLDEAVLLNMEDSVMLSDSDDLSLWHLKTKAAWPVAPRDSVTIRRVYPSPSMSSVHVLSFSTDDTKLFPSIPSPVLPTIRSQVDIYGWSVEALSPTTTRITLLEQSDPKGWSSKSWTPTQMVSALGLVGEFTIKYGGPPLVSSLLGARTTSSVYEHGKRTLKLEYKTIAVSASSVEKVSSVAGAEETSIVECKIRCDCSVWASSIVLIIDPPPLRVSCVSRHRLSEGGGLWITIEHERKVAGDKHFVLVRRGAEDSVKGSVLMNGAAMEVEVETMLEDEIKLLSTKKRVRNTPIPLDSHQPLSSRTPDGRNSSGRSSPFPPVLLRSESASAIPSSPPSRNPSSLVEAALNPPTTPKVPLRPPGHALEALAWLQTFHAEQGPELADPAPGWSIVSEKASVVVRKKLIPAVSEVMPVYRGDKIVQGLSADEIAGLVSPVGTRSTWDEGISTAVPLASYGNGISTALLTSTAVFPFRPRIFHVASVNAQVKIPSASASSSTSTILFCASASYPPDDRFDADKLNPTGLLPGAILLQGWILETLDPYTSSLYAIPSTRCTFISCVDHASYVPLAFNSVLNVSLARVINTVENLGKTKGPLPQEPVAVLQIEGPLSDDGDQECVWKLTNPSPSRSTNYSSDYSIKTSTFRSLYRIAPAPKSLSSNLSKSRPVGKSYPAPIPPSLIPATSLAAIVSGSAAASVPATPPNGGGSLLLKSELPRSVSLNFSPPTATTALLQKPSMPEITRKTSLVEMRESRSKSPPSSNLEESPRKKATLLGVGASRAATKEVEDIVVAELIIDLKQYPEGYSISAISTLDFGTFLPLESFSSSTAPNNRIVPLRATVHEAPLTPIVSASLESWKRQNHLVRIRIPTSSLFPSTSTDGADMPVIKASIPDWYKRLNRNGVVVEVKISPFSPTAPPPAKVVPVVEEVGGKKERVVGFNGEVLVVATEKESKSVLARFEDEDWSNTGAKISRVPRKRNLIASLSLNPDSTLPPELRDPVAVSNGLLALVVDVPVEFPDPKSPGAVTPSDEANGSRSPLLGSKISPGIAQQVERTDSPIPLLGNLLGSYPLPSLGANFASVTSPLAALTSSTPTSTTPASKSTPTNSEKSYSLSFVFGVAIIAFLLGSFLRSLVSPSDYILSKPSGSTTISTPESLAANFLGETLGGIESLLSSSASLSSSPSSGRGRGRSEVETALMLAFDPDRKWREGVRLLPALPSWIGGRWDLFVAVVRRD